MSVRPRGGVEPMPGAVLVGGRSRRMGRPKAQIRIGDRESATYVVRALRPVTERIFLVGEAAGLDHLGLMHVRDIRPEHGPLGGLETAFLESRAERLVVVACDLPCVTPALLRRLQMAAVGYQAAVPNVGGQRHPLCAVYDRSCLPVIQRRLDDGTYGMLEMLNEITCCDVFTDAEGNPLDPDLLINVNTPPDVE
ncbi:MAG: NTP transferase domain-containing protein, partial [Candidatus Eisenbacteria bacterium]|nr:NTP transferase domain-containing protein [Candidatus Eisenbacteria bacterium]